MISIYVAATHLIPRFSWMENACAPPPSPLFLLGRNCHSNYFQSYQHTHTIKWSASALPHSLCFRLVLLFECRRYCTRGNYVAGTRWASALCSGRKGQILMHPGRRILGRFTPIIRLLLTTLKFSYLCQFEIIFYDLLPFHSSTGKRRQ